LGIELTIRREVERTNVFVVVPGMEISMHTQRRLLTATVVSGENTIQKRSLTGIKEAGQFGHRNTIRFAHA